MVKRLANKIKQEKEKYNFKQAGIAGLCPDCGHVVEFKSYFQEFYCTDSNCAFVANINGERVWDNKKREENLKKIKEEMQNPHCEKVW